MAAMATPEMGTTLMVVSCERGGDNDAVREAILYLTYPNRLVW
jgi:hypothetical protein